MSSRTSWGSRKSTIVSHRPAFHHPHGNSHAAARDLSARGRRPLCAALALALLHAALATAPAEAQRAAQPRPDDQVAAAEDGSQKVHLDFQNVDLSVVIEMIARTTGRNFIYDDKVRGKVTIVSPTPVDLDQAYAVFESVLKIKGFTAIQGPAGVLQIIPVRQAKESNIETIRDSRPSENRDHFVTRLIPLLYIDAAAITNTIKPLVSKDASMVAYEPTNTIILTDTATNIRRLLTILDAIDVETFREELAVIKIKHAEAATLGAQISEIYQAEVSSSSASSNANAARRARSSRRTKSSAAGAGVTPAASRGRVRIITDDRTNSLLILATRSKLDDIRVLIHSLDVPVVGGGRIHVYYLKYADAEELAQTLTGLLSGTGGGPRGPAGGAAGQPQALRGQVTALAEGLQLSADPSTNSLVIQGSKEAYETLVDVIEQLDIERPQVLVEALIMEVNVSGGQELGMNTRLIIDKTVQLGIQSATDAATTLAQSVEGGTLAGGAAAIAGPIAGVSAFGANFLYSGGGTQIQAILRATAADANTNIVAAPHILTSDNEEAEIQIGQNIPIITNRVNTATGNITGQTTSVAVERQDVGVILRVTPQISEGDSLRLKIFQSNTTVIEDAGTGDPNEVGVSLAKREIENTLVVADGQTVVIGGLLSEDYTDTIVKTPFLGDIPLLGWLFKTTSKQLRKINLLVFLTPHIIRSTAEMEEQSIRKRRQFEERLGDEYLVSGERSDREQALGQRSKNPVIVALGAQAERYPLARMVEIEEEREREQALLEAERAAAASPDLYIVSAGLFHDQELATERLTLLLDRGYDASILSGEADGSLVFELRVGPYETNREAEDVAVVLVEAFGFDTSVMLIPGDPDSPRLEQP